MPSCLRRGLPGASAGKSPFLPGTTATVIALLPSPPLLRAIRGIRPCLPYPFTLVFLDHCPASFPSSRWGQCLHPLQLGTDPNWLGAGGYRRTRALQALLGPKGPAAPIQPRPVFSPPSQPPRSSRSALQSPPAAAPPDFILMLAHTWGQSSPQPASRQDQAPQSQPKAVPAGLAFSRQAVARGEAMTPPHPRPTSSLARFPPSGRANLNRSQSRAAAGTTTLLGLQAVARHPFTSSLGALWAGRPTGRDDGCPDHLRPTPYAWPAIPVLELAVGGS